MIGWLVALGRLFADVILVDGARENVLLGLDDVRDAADLHRHAEWEQRMLVPLVLGGVEQSAQSALRVDTNERVHASPAQFRE